MNIMEHTSESQMTCLKYAGGVILEGPDSGAISYHRGGADPLAL